MVARKQSGYPGMMLYTPSEPAAWKTLPRTVQDALDELADGQGGEGGGANFVWRPGGVAGGNVFTTWIALAAAIASVDGQKSVTVDVSIAPAHVTAGSYAGIVDVTFVAGGGSGASVSMNVDDGAHFTYPAASQSRLSFDGVSVEVFNNDSATIALTGSQVLELFFRNSAFLDTNGSKGFVDVGGEGLVCWLQSSDVLSGTAPAFNCSNAGASLDFLMQNGAALNASTIAGAAGTVGVSVDAASLQGLARGFAAATLTVGVDVLDPPSQLAIDPLGAPQNGVYVTWEALMFARGLIDDPVTIFFYDDVHMPTVSGGTPWNFAAYTVLEGFATLTIDDGAKFKFAELHIKNLTVVNEATTSPAVITGDVACYIDDFATVTSAVGAAALFDDTAAGLTLIIGENGTVGDGTHAVLKSETASGTAVQLAGILATLKDNALSTGAGGGITIDRVPSSILNTPLVQNAATIAAYTYREVVNTVQQTGNGGTGTHTVTATTGNIAKAKSGKVMVSGSCAGSTAAADAITATLVRDVAGANTTIATQTVTTTATQLNYNVAFSFLDTLPDSANHTYSIRLAGAQNNTVGANQAIVTAIEQ